MIPDSKKTGKIKIESLKTDFVNDKPIDAVKSKTSETVLSSTDMLKNKVIDTVKSQISSVQSNSDMLKNNLVSQSSSQLGSNTFNSGRADLLKNTLSSSVPTSKLNHADMLTNNVTSTKTLPKSALAKNSLKQYFEDQLLSLVKGKGLYFSIQIGDLPPDTFNVVDFTLEEALSTLFTLTLSLSSHNANIELQKQLLQKATLTIYADGEKQRVINGIVEGAILGDVGFKRSFYTFKVRPTAWQLTLSQDSRIFHFKSVPDILAELLQKYHIRAECQFMDPHPVREYTTQKRENDYDFFCRLAAEEGIMFWFEEDKMFYSDSHLGMTAGLDLIYNPHPQSALKEHVINKWQFGTFMRPNEAILQDYKYTHPDVMLDSKLQNLKEKPVYSFYDSYGRFDNEKTAQQFTRYRLEALQADSEQGLAESNTIQLMPGKIFQLTEHPANAMNERWQVVKITHHGRLPQSLSDESDAEPAILTNTFSFIPGRNDWRPAFIHKPLVDGDEIATVVGPADEEIYVNEDGAVKIHFYWNRYDNADENASCWVRVLQNWNGDGFGFLAMPRIGQEVVVSYLNGDIDRPIIVGTTYNGNNRPPLDLPAAKTRMSIKSKTHKGAGFNEIRFEDDVGKQEFFIHAQKDMNTIVADGDQTDTVKLGDRKVTVQTGNETKNIEQGKLEEIIALMRSTTANQVQVQANAGEGGAGTQLYKATDEIKLDVEGSIIELTPKHIKLSKGGSSILITADGIAIDGNVLHLNKDK